MRHLLTIAISLLFLASCSKPSFYERFCRIQDGTGVCRFEIDFSDSAATYDIGFYTRLDGRNRTREDFPLLLTWTSPSGASYSERVFFPVSEASLRFSDALSTQLQTPYRSIVRPRECGVWTLDVGVNGVKGLCGIGVICERKDNGTR